MFKAVSKGSIVALIFIAFIGQTMSLSMAVPCDASIDAQHSSVSERTENKETASIASDLSAHCCDVDCCDLDCICIANACSSIVYLADFLGLTPPYFITILIFSQPTEQPITFASLLYRPPIFA